MDYEIIPLAVTKVEWSIFVDVCQRILGVSPTRGLDATHLAIDDPAAYLACLNMRNEPLDSLRRGGLGSTWFGHFSITFAMVLDTDGVIQLCNTGLCYTWKKGLKRDQYLSLVTGTMDQWYAAILGTDETSDYTLRFIMNTVLARFQQAGFREVFSRFSKQTLSDGTFILKS